MTNNEFLIIRGQPNIVDVIKFRQYFQILNIKNPWVSNLYNYLNCYMHNFSSLQFSKPYFNTNSHLSATTQINSSDYLRTRGNLEGATNTVVDYVNTDGVFTIFSW